MGTLRIIGKELASVKENIPFNLATVVSPLLFLFAFAVMVSGGISIPVETQPASSESAFLQATAEYRAPDGTPYLELETAPAEGAPDGRSADRYIVMDELAVSTLVFGAMLAGLLFGQLSMTSEWENATAKLLVLSPRPAASVAAGKVAAAFLKALVAGAVLVGVVALMYGRALASAPWLVASLCLMYVVFASLGLALGIAVRSTMTAFLVSLVASLCLWVAGGGFGDLSYFGEAAQAVGAANPATYALDAVRYAYFGGVADPTPLVVLAVGAAATLAAVCAIYARWTRSERAVS